MTVTIHDIAKAAGVSVSTVSKVLNEKSRCSLDTRERVFRIASEMGYIPNAAARSLVTGKSNCVGFMCGDLYPSLYGMLVAVTRVKLSELGYEMMIGSWPTIKSSHIDGLMVFDEAKVLAKHYDWLRTKGIALVGLGTRFGCCSCDLDIVNMRLANACETLLQQLYGQGCRNIVFAHSFDCEDWRVNYDDRHLVYDSFMERYGLIPRCLQVSCLNRIVVRSEVAGYLCGNERPDAIYCSNDEVAIGVCAALRDVGLSETRDVLVSGCDGVWDAKCNNPEVTTIDIEIPHLVETAAMMLHRRINNPGLPSESLNLSAGLMVRESTIKLRKEAML